MRQSVLRLGFAVTSGAASLAFVFGSGRGRDAVPSGTVVAAPGTAVPGCVPSVVNFDIVYVRAPRFGDDTNTSWPETKLPLRPDAGADLRLLHPDCTEELLFPLPAHQGIIDAPIGPGSVADPNVSFDGRYVAFAYFHDQAAMNAQRGVSRKGADIYRLDLTTRDVRRLTTQTYTPNTGNGANLFCSLGGVNCPQMGVFNVGPAFVATGDPARPKIAFTSTRNAFLPPKPLGGWHALQLFTMDFDGKNVDQIGHLNLSQALHPYQLRDGRLMFTSWENQGLRAQTAFSLWFIGPDGTKWASGSGFGEYDIGHHFMTQMSNDDIVVGRYYSTNNNGFGDLVRFPLDPPGPDFLAINQPGSYMSFQRPGQIDLTRWADVPWVLAEDYPAPCNVGGPMSSGACAGGSSGRVGKVTHPAVTPGDDLLLVYTPGAANHNGIYVGLGLAKPYYDGGLYLMPRGLAQSGGAAPGDLRLIVNNPSYSEQWPRPVVPYSALFPGQDQPAVWSELQNQGEAEHGLLPNTPFGLIGTSSLIWRDTAPRNTAPDPDPFNQGGLSMRRWTVNGADSGRYTDDDIYAVRLLALLPSTDRRYPNSNPGFANYATERMRILGEIPVRHEGVVDQKGNTDTSFLARIPADTSFTFQTLDRNGMVLNMAQTWHQVRPGEARYDCGGCHAHTKAPLDFETTVAGQPGYQPTDVALQTPLLQVRQLHGSPTTTTANVPQVTLEYNRDVKPILAQRCSGCHQDDLSDGKLNLFADATPAACGGSWPGTYYRLAQDRATGGAGCRFGLGVPAGGPSFFIQPQQTRYVRAFQSRDSLLIWKVFGARLDGRTNELRAADIDYDPATDPIHPNLASLRGLTWDEKMTLARWVDLGAPIELNTSWGWLEDDLRPTLWVSPTLGEASSGPVSSVTVAAYDLESGLAPGSLVAYLNIPVGAAAPGTNLAQGIDVPNGGTVNVTLPQSVDLIATGAVLTVRIKDRAGHQAEIVRAFNASVSVNNSPVAQIAQPASGALYTAGTTVSYSGTGSDIEDGSPLPASALTWRVDLLDASGSHPVVAPTSGVTGGSFAVPATGPTASSYYRIQLTARDSQGLAQTATRDVGPRVVNVTLASAPSGLQLKLDGQTVQTPYVLADVAGKVHSVEAVSPQLVAGVSQLFGSWSDGGARVHNVTVPSAAATYTATFAPAPTNTAPTSSITQPALGTLYSGGATIAYAGTGVDVEDGGALPASAFTWRADLVVGGTTRAVLAPTSGATSGSFAVPTNALTPTSVLRIQLTVRDSKGLTHTTTRNLNPRVVSLTLASEPSGLQLRLDSQNVQTPFAFSAVTGSARALEAVSPQTVAGVTQVFSAWSDQGARVHNITVPSSTATYTATYGAAAPQARAEITSPSPGAKLTGTSATFSWNAGTGVNRYRLEVGTSAGAKDIYAGSNTASRSRAVSSLPSNGSTIYVRLWSRFSATSTWEYSDYTYKAVGPGARITSPTPGTRLASTRVTFYWSSAGGATSYRLQIGTTPQGSDIYNGSSTTSRQRTVSNLPRGNHTLYVRLATVIAGTTYYEDFTYTAPAP